MFRKDSSMRFRLLGVMALALSVPLLFAGCGGGDDLQAAYSARLTAVAAVATPTEVSHTPAPAAVAVAAVATEIPTPVAPPTLALNTNEVKRQLKEVEAQTAQMRGLKPKRDVPEHFISQDQMKYQMTQDTLKDYTKEMARQDVIRLWLLMFIDDPTMDFRQLEIEFSGEAILGYYDHNA